PMRVTNYAGTTFDLEVTRTVRLLAEPDVATRLGLTMRPESGVRLVAYESENRVTNTGARPWTKESGLLSIWILAMFTPSPDANVVIPFERGEGPVPINDRYFGKVPSDRLHVRDEEGFL